MTLVRSVHPQTKDRFCWRLNDERMYLYHLLNDHGKIRTGSQVRIDSIEILTSWLETVDTRDWDFKSVNSLRPVAISHLNELNARMGVRGK